MCCGSLGEVLQGGSMDKRRRGGWEEGLLTHFGGGRGVDGVGVADVWTAMQI